jgi:hypothetical protein
MRLMVLSFACGVILHKIMMCDWSGSLTMTFILQYESWVTAEKKVLSDFLCPILEISSTEVSPFHYPSITISDNAARPNNGDTLVSH